MYETQSLKIMSPMSQFRGKGSSPSLNLHILSQIDSLKLLLRMSHASWEMEIIIGVGPLDTIFRFESILYILKGCEHTLYLEHQLRSGGKLIECLK